MVAKVIHFSRNTQPKSFAFQQVMTLVFDPFSEKRDLTHLQKVTSALSAQADVSRNRSLSLTSYYLKG